MAGLDLAFRFSIAFLHLFACGYVLHRVVKKRDPGRARLIFGLPMAVSGLAIPTLLFDRESEVFFIFLFGLMSSWLMPERSLALCFGYGSLERVEDMASFIASVVLPVRIKAAANGRGPARVNLGVLGQSCASLLGGVILMYIYQVHAKDANPLLARLLLVPFIIYTLACWAMDLFAFLAQATLGLEFEPCFKRPYLSTSHSEFWARRWNLTVAEMLKETLYVPMRTCGYGRNVAAVATFAVSGLAHEAIMIMCTGVVTMEWGAFFMVAALLVLAEDALAPKGGMGRYLTLASLSAAAEMLFYPPPLRAGLDGQVFGQFLRFFRLMD